jgi:hypothetical protein
MSLRPPSNRRERSIVYGRFDSGKSHAWLSIAEWIHNTGSTARMYVADTDNSWEAMRPSDGHLDEIIQVTDLDVTDYRPWLEWVAKTKTVINREDWVVVDMIDDTYGAAQTFYWDSMAPDDLLADIYLRNQQNINSKGSEGESMAGAHGGNWGVIYKYYFAFITPIVNMKCNVLCCARAKEVSKEDKPEIVNSYPVGWRPAGPGAFDKDLAHSFLTVIFAAKTPRGWIYTTIREKGPVGETRGLLKGEIVDDYVQTYLFGIAGWRP